jgi:hypothetical protein
VFTFDLLVSPVGGQLMGRLDQLLGFDGELVEAHGAPPYLQLLSDQSSAPGYLSSKRIETGCDGLQARPNMWTGRGAVKKIGSAGATALTWYDIAAALFF